LIKSTVDNKRKQQERMTKILEKNISDQINRIDKKKDYVQPNIHFDKNVCVDSTLRVMMLPSEKELNKFKKFPKTKIMSHSVTTPIGNINSLPRLRMSCYDNEIRRMMPQYSYCLNRLKRDSVASKFHEKRNNYSLIKEIQRLHTIDHVDEVNYDEDGEKSPQKVGLLIETRIAIQLRLHVS